MNDDIVEELEHEILHAQREGRLSDGQFFEACLSEILELRKLIEGEKVFGSGYLVGESERIALATANSDLRWENSELKRMLSEVVAVDDREVPFSVFEALTKLDKLTNMIESIHRLLTKQGDDFYKAKEELL